MHPVRVRPHVDPHYCKDEDYDRNGHDPHHAHVGFFTILLVLLCHGVLRIAGPLLPAPLISGATDFTELV